ncbi:MAG TPA: Zn-dependent hydrolase [Verrucomicrobiae bacterium]|jgi:beta-ureidopropionase / N-carbamoyl-L-amino-acid hydrolase|nr:Zn-dependent hydrolase [Verrucomicrobiae bacterium]
MPSPRAKEKARALPERLAINKDRLLADLNAISRIGIGDRGSVTRLVFSVTELRSRQLLVHLMTQAGLKVQVDRIGNIFGRLEGGGGPAVLAGSHLDSVVHGGKFDGPVGVIGALEAVRTIKESAIALPCPLEAVCFVGEESSRFGFSTLGSSLVAGQVRMKDLTNAVDARGTKLEDVLAGLGVYRDSLPSLRRDPKSVRAYLELHIEQGPVLEAKKKKIGVVTAIAAPTRLRVVFTGQADHSGTTPMEMRKDALVAAALLIAHVEETARENSAVEKGRVVGTVGAIKIDPGVINAIPGKAELSIDIRSITAKAKERVARAVEARAKEIAADRGMKVEILPIRSEEPVDLDAGLIRLIEEICEEKKLPYEIMPSGAGHDAMQMAKIAPAGMIFVPSKKGISHSPLEWTDPDEICLGAQILLETIVRIAYEAS